MEYDYEDYSHCDDDLLIDGPIHTESIAKIGPFKALHIDAYTAIIDLLKDLYMNCDRLDWLTDEQHELYARLTSEDGE